MSQAYNPSHTSVLEGQVPLSVFLKSYPFYFVWDDRNTLLELGPSLRKICPQIRVGDRVQDAFICKQPKTEFSLSTARHFANQLIIFEDRLTHRILRGTPIFLENQGLSVMLASAWITDPNQLAEYDLTLNDFAIQDQTIDLLHLLQTQKMVSRDLEQLNKNLNKKSLELKKQKETLQKLALVAARTHNAVIVTDAQSRIEWVNEGFTRMTGWSQEEVIGLRPSQFLQGPETQRDTVRHMSDCLRARKAFNTEVINYSREGRKYWVSIEVQPVFNESGEVSNFMAIESDITERKNAEEALRTSEALARRQRDELEWIYENAPIGLCFFDKDLRYRRINRWLADVNGHPQDAHIGKTVREMLPSIADRIEAVAEQVRITGQGVKSEDVRGEFRSKPGIVRYFNDTWFPAFDQEGRVNGFGIIVQEITESKRIQTLSEIDRLKNEFLATLAHELRNPLGTIAFTLDLILSRTEQESAKDESNRAALLRAQRQTNHLVRLVDDLLELSRVSHGKIDLKREVRDLTEILLQATELVQPKINAKKHELTTHIPDQKIPIDCDPVRIVQLIANLLDNAAKYTNPGGHIELDCSVVDHQVLITVRDNGIGIPSEKLSIIFEVFSQIKHGPERRQDGIGIGLALARKLAELHGGSLNAQSDGPGRGSLFTVTLPVLKSFSQKRDVA